MERSLVHVGGQLWGIPTGDSIEVECVSALTSEKVFSWGYRHRLLFGRHRAKLDLNLPDVVDESIDRIGAGDGQIWSVLVQIWAEISRSMARLDLANSLCCRRIQSAGLSHLGRRCGNPGVSLVLPRRSRLIL